jgi:ABC-2 type transport system permease protein
VSAPAAELTRTPVAPWRPSASLAVAFEAFVMQFKTARENHSNLIIGIVQPASFLLIVALAARGTGRVDVGQAALGVILLSLWGATVWSSGSVLRAERWQGTLAPLLARPAGLGPVLVGKGAGVTGVALVLIGSTVTATAAVLGDPITVRAPLPFVAALAAVVVSATALGLLLGCVFMLTRAAGRISEALMYPVFILGGMLVPLELLPRWVEPLSTLVSLR